MAGHLQSKHRSTAIQVLANNGRLFLLAFCLFFFSMSLKTRPRIAGSPRFFFINPPRIAEPAKRGRVSALTLSEPRVAEHLTPMHGNHGARNSPQSETSQI